MSFVYNSLLQLAQASSAVDYPLNAEAGSFTLTGSNATLSKTFAPILDASSTTITISGSEATLILGRTLVAEGSGIGQEMFLAHFNNSLTDEYGKAADSSFKVGYVTGVFNQGLSNNSVGSMGATYNMSLDFGTDDFTVEFRQKIGEALGSPLSTLVAASNNSFIKFHTSDLSPRFSFSQYENFRFSPLGADYDVHAYAFVRKGTKLYCFRDGVALDAYNDTDGSFVQSGYATVGASVTANFSNFTLSPASSTVGASYMDELRITRGAALYTANYTPASSAFTKTLAGYPITTYPATLIYTHSIELSATSYTVSGSPSFGIRASNFLADSTSFILTGLGASLGRNITLNAEVSSYAVSGQGAGLLIGRNISADASSYSVTGNTAYLLANRTLDAESPSAITDPYYANTIFYQSFDTDFSDWFGHTVGTPSNIARNTSNKLFGAAEAFPTNTDKNWYYSTGLGSDADFLTTDFTIEFALRIRNTSTNSMILAVPGNYNRLHLGNNSGWRFWLVDNSGGIEQNLPLLTTGWDDGAYHRFAISYNYSNGTVYTYQDGTLLGSTVVGQRRYNFSGAYVGSITFTGYSPDAGIDEIRITRGVARYTGASYTLENDPFYAGGVGYTIEASNPSNILGRGLTAAYTAFSYTGTDADLVYTPSANQFPAGAYLHTGSDSTGYIGYGLNASSSNYTLTGSGNNFLYDRTVKADPYTFIISSYTTNINLVRNSIAGSYSITGNQASLLKDNKGINSAGSYILTGQDVTFDKSRNLYAVSGTYVYTGVDASVIVGQKLSPGSFTVTGTPATLQYIESLLTAGNFTFTGFDSFAYLTNLVMRSDSGSYRISFPNGYPAVYDVRDGIVYGENGEFIGTWEAVDYSIKYDIETEKLVKILSNTLVISL